MDKYECMECGYVYDPAKGDPLRGIPPGISFSDLPSTWRCPACSAGKGMFKKASQ